VRPRILHPRARAVLIVGALLLGSVLLLAEKTAAAVLTVPYVTNPVADADLDGNPATGDWSGAASTAIPLENGEPLSYGTATLYTKHNGTVAFFRIDGYVDVPWASATGNHFWLGWQMSPSGTAHHGTGTWDGALFGLWNGVDYAPAATSPPRPVDTNGFSKPPVADGSQDLVGAMATAGAAVPYAFTAEWRRTMDTGDPSDIVFVPDGATALNFFVTTDSDGDGSEGGAVAHNVVTNANTLIFGRPAGAPPVIPAGALVCGPEGDPLADGHARPLEYHATYFDPNTKITLYMTCSEDPSTMHVAIATPWSGWASLLVQATDSDASSFNEVQVMHGDEGGALALDAYANESTALTRDVDAGGTQDVAGVAHGHDNPVHVYEFSVPLRSNDSLDSRLDSVGPYTLAIAYNATTDSFGGTTEGSSGLQVFYVDPAAGRRKEPTTVDFLPAPAGNSTDGSVYLVTLRNSTGYPVPGSTIYPFVRTAFGFLDIGPVETDEDGVATFSYTPLGEGKFLVGVGYAGGTNLSASVAWYQIESVGPAEAAGAVVRPVEAIVAMALAGVWSTYAYAYFLVRQTFRNGSPGLLSRLRHKARGPHVSGSSEGGDPPPRTGK